MNRLIKISLGNKNEGYVIVFEDKVIECNAL